MAAGRRRQVAAAPSLALLISPAPLATAATWAAGNPLPERLHEVLPKELVVGRRVLIVGDLHGCFDELQASCGFAGFTQWAG